MESVNGSTKNKKSKLSTLARKAKLKKNSQLKKTSSTKKKSSLPKSKKRKRSVKQKTLVERKESKFANEQEKAEGVKTQNATNVNGFTCENSNLFPNWKPLKVVWKRLNPDEYQEFLPPTKTSISFQCQHYSGSKSSWRTLDCFESSYPYKNSCSSMLFAGGNVCCAAWCSIAKSSNTHEYIALTTVVNAAQGHDSKFSPGLIQIWSLGTEANLKSVPCFKLGISHRFGKIWKMSWCPWGAWEEDASKSKEIFPRLGLLALACSDGPVRIYSIPHPRFLRRSSSRLPIYDVSPVAILSNKLSAMCTSLSWSGHSDCNKIAAGYSNGLISLYTLVDGEHTSIMPFLTFQAQASIISSICFAPICRWLSSSCFIDRSLNVWDTVEPGIPVFSLKTPIKEIKWCLGLCGIFFMTDSPMSSVCYIERNRERQVLSYHIAPSMSFSVNEQLKMIIHADLAGEVTATPISFNGKPKNGHLFSVSTLRHLFKTQLVITQTTRTRKNPLPTHGLVFIDFYEITSKQSITKRSLKVTKGQISEWGHLDDAQWTSINCVEWNSHESRHWLFLGGSSGLCRILKFSS